MVENESPKEDNSKRLGKRNIERWIECVQYGMDVLRMKLVPGTVSASAKGICGRDVTFNPGGMWGRNRAPAGDNRQPPQREFAVETVR